MTAQSPARRCSPSSGSRTALLLGGLRVDGVGQVEAGQRRRRRARSAVPATAHWRAAVRDVAQHVVDPGAAARSSRRPRAGRRRVRSPGTARSSAGQTASRSTAWWCSRTRPIRSACRVSVGGALGLAGRRPGGQLAEQPQLAADQLVQHALVGDGAAASRGRRRGRRAGAGRRSDRVGGRAERGSGIVHASVPTADGHGAHLDGGLPDGCREGRGRCGPRDRGFRMPGRRRGCSGSRAACRVTRRDARPRRPVL